MNAKSDSTYCSWGAAVNNSSKPNLFSKWFSGFCPIKGTVLYICSIEELQGKTVYVLLKLAFRSRKLTHIDCWNVIMTGTVMKIVMARMRAYIHECKWGLHRAMGDAFLKLY